MTIADGLMILAVLLGPILAIQVQKIIEYRKEKSGRRLSIFKTLMATRGAPISYAHVEALNMIEIEFHPHKKFKNIIDQWKIYLDHLASAPQDRAASTYNADFATWSSKNNEHLIDLLYIMSKQFGYDFDKVTLKKGVYVPKGHNDIEIENQFIRRSFIDVLLGRKSLPINVVNQIQEVPDRNE